MFCKVMGYENINGRDCSRGPGGLESQRVTGFKRLRRSFVLEFVQEATQVLVQTAISHRVPTTISDEIYPAAVYEVDSSKPCRLPTCEDLHSEETGFSAHPLGDHISRGRGRSRRGVRLQFVYGPRNCGPGLGGERPKLSERPSPKRDPFHGSAPSPGSDLVAHLTQWCQLRCTRPDLSDGAAGLL